MPLSFIMTPSLSLFPDKPEFTVRIVVCDHYSTKPTPGVDVIYSDFRGADIKQVPVLRIFGPTPDGRKACVHIHGVFPYFYIPCPTPNPEPQFLYQIAASLDKALNIALKQATSSNQHVYKITLVKGLPFYGFHDKDHLYLKVFLYSPGLIKQAVELCSNGAILGQTFQPHESHINFTLQFFIDFNLFGMSNIDFQTVVVRRSGLSLKSNESFDANVSKLKPESMCFYEADCIASHIINRQKVGKGDGIENPGLEEVWNQEIQRRKKLNISLASKSLTQGRINSEGTESHHKFKDLFISKIPSLNNKPIIEHGVDVIKEACCYPAETIQGSQLVDAVDISVHLPDNTLGTNVINTTIRDLDETYMEAANDTLVDENVALNSSLSLHYSQVLLNSEDLELVDLMQGMEDNSIEEDSIMETPADDSIEDDNESNDGEYSQVFNEDTLLLSSQHSKDDTNKTSLSWNDTFWNEANIPQLDGTCDDDYVKKVRKRKKRPFKLGLSRPKSKTKEAITSPSDVDEINQSRETIDNISQLHLKKFVNSKQPNLVITATDEDTSVANLVDMLTQKENSSVLKPAELYDLKNKFAPEAGSSTAQIKNETYMSEDNVNDSDISLSDSKIGIVSFYDNSKLFDLSLSDNDNGSKQSQETIYGKNKLNLIQLEDYVNCSEIEHVNKVNHKNEISSGILCPAIKPPLKSYVASTLKNHKIPNVRNLQPFFSDYKDVGDKVEIGQIMLKLQSKLSRDQKPFDKVLDTASIEEWRQLLFLQTNNISQESSKPDALKLLLAGNRTNILEPVKKAPKRKVVEEWAAENAIQSISKNIDISKQSTEDNMNRDDLENSQVLGLNEDFMDNSISEEISGQDKSSLNTLQMTMQFDGSFLCFGSNEICADNNCSTEAAAVDANFLTLMLVEVHTSVRGELHPDTNMDPIEAIFYTVTNDCPPGHFLPKSYTGILVIDNGNDAYKYLDRCIQNIPITYLNNENDIIEKVIELIKQHDPDILCGYEIEMKSWGYVFERAQILGIDIITDISRITEKYRQKRWRQDERDFEGRIIGRVIFNVWRLFRHELALSSYSFENCMYEVLKERIPMYSYTQLSEWWSDESRIFRWIPVDYYLMKLSGTVRMLEKLDIINRTSELARLFGLQWWEVLSRGSQFRVESLMLRAARPLNLIALSPTVKQRAKMRAPECLPLIFEPESRFYSDPVIVLDFQSLYPSMMIAYNYCFSTCIGRVQNITGDSAYEFGAWRLKVPRSKLEALANNGLVNWSPVGVGFVKPSVRRGVLPSLLRRILAARQAVKKSMKMQTDEAVKKAMHSRQLGLKLIANVTYGYTSANFSGRMPCVEVGDSVVAKGRETLERAIKLVQNNTKWNAKVVYGDTDSMFVLIPGGTRDEAFEIGQEIADAVTADNPSPVALKFEKVYQPCILQTKKRYVGYMYESREQENPIYEAKGIETVRRDGCPAGVKLLRESLCELFSTGDMSRVKRRVQSVLSRLAEGSLPAHQLLFTREYHGPTGYRASAAAPPREIAMRIGARDMRAVPRTGWRVSWLVTAGAPGAPLVRLARTPTELLRDPSLRPHVSYYAARVLLPPLHRCLSLLGVDVFKWWTELGYTRTAQQRELSHAGGIARYMSRERCAVCGARVTLRAGGNDAVCVDCAHTQRAAATLNTRFATADTLLNYCNTICKSCCNHPNVSVCENTECPVLWKRLSTSQMVSQTQELLSHLPSQSVRF